MLAAPALIGTGLAQSSNTIRIGFVTPQTGPLAGNPMFSETVAAGSEHFKRLVCGS